MLFVKRNSEGKIVAVSFEESSECREPISSTAPELAEFSCQLSGKHQELAQSDLPMVRVLDDLIDILLARDIFRFTDFPQEAQRKLLERRHLREQMNGLELLDEEGEEKLL